jgi:calcineurin-like phosphoesterase family protein
MTIALAPHTTDGLRYFSADWHFHHARIIEFTDRPYPDTDTMDAAFVDTWNSTVRPNDESYVLGDLALGSFERAMEILASLNGHKFLIPGNHDRVSSHSNKPAYREKFRDIYAAAGFETLDEVVTFQIGGRPVLASHYPYAGDSHELDRFNADRYAKQRPVDTGLPLIHGHVHNEWRYRGREFNVGVDVNGFQLVPESEIAAWVATLD